MNQTQHSTLALTDWEKLTPETALKAVTRAIDHAHNALANLLMLSDYSWPGLMEPLDEILDAVNRTFAPLKHLDSVAGNLPDIHEAHDRAKEAFVKWSTELLQDQDLYHAVRALADGPNYQGLTADQQQVVKLLLRDFLLGGVSLPKGKRTRFQEIASELSRLETLFEKNVTDATQKGWFAQVIDKRQLDGLSEAVVSEARKKAEDRGLQGWVLTLDLHVSGSVMKNARNRQLREDMYEGYMTRASDRGPDAGRFDNTKIMKDILALRTEMAGLLELKDYAEVSLASKMAPNTETVLVFLRGLADKVRTKAEEEYREILASAKEDGIDELRPWDVKYYEERVKRLRYGFDDEVLRPYFPLPRVLSGLFVIADCLYGIEFRERKDVSVWHSDVLFYEVWKGDTLRGRLFVDPYARKGKRGGAWMENPVNRRLRADGSLQLPVAYLFCNFSPPTKGDAGKDIPSLLTHEEVETLSHEFGHCLHHLLTKTEHFALGAIESVPWDAIELPSLFMQNFCWTPEGLALLSGHIETGENIPAELLEKILAARNFGRGLFFLRQVEFALFDFVLHMERGGRGIQEIMDAVRREVTVIIPPEWVRFQHSFSHAFGQGGYSAGYYVYSWAWVLADDAFAAFEEGGVFSFNRDTGERFEECILSCGGSRDFVEMFEEFRGRKPTNEAFLRRHGFLEAA